MTMFLVVLSLISMGSIGLALYTMINKSELVGQIRALQAQIQEDEEWSSTEISTLKSELAQLEKIRNIPNIIERGKRLEAEIAARLEQAEKAAETLLVNAATNAEARSKEAAIGFEQAQEKAKTVIQVAERDAEARKARFVEDAERDRQIIRIVRINAEAQARQILAEAQSEAKRIMASTRKDAREKTQKVEEIFDLATVSALEIRSKAEAKAKEIGGQAYEALRRHDFYAAAAQAMKNRIEGYGDTYLVPADHVLDELAYEFGFHMTGEKLKLARERVKIMERNGTAATCQYPDGWKKDYAISFVLGAFNGKVDAILARIKPANHNKLILEIRDTFALTNRNGEVFREARVREEFLEARLEELKWGVAVQKIKEKDRDEQKALKDKIREDEKAQKELEKAAKEAKREEELLAKALEKVREELTTAHANFVKPKKKIDARSRWLRKQSAATST